VNDYLAALDAFVLPSRLESFGNGVVEAMALGIASVVMADCPALIEHVRDGETGFVADDTEHLAAILTRVRDDDPLREAVGRAGASSVAERYSLERMASAYRLLYERALSARGASAIMLPAR
jgi:glycosyltransferase involved in cell wall biosynthesis